MKSFHSPCPYGNDDCPKCNQKPMTNNLKKTIEEQDKRWTKGFIEAADFHARDAAIVEAVKRDLKEAMKLTLPVFNEYGKGVSDAYESLRTLIENYKIEEGKE